MIRAGQLSGPSLDWAVARIYELERLAEQGQQPPQDTQEKDPRG